MSPGTRLVYRFEDFELDPGRFELRRAGVPVPAEPQVLSLLLLLAANAERLVSRDELAEKVWNHAGVSDATIASRIKSARRALADDGTQQRLIRTVHGRGFRFVGELRFAGTPWPESGGGATAAGAPAAAADARPSIAVLPFSADDAAGPLAIVADALADELIADLSRLRWLLVIARTSTFRFRGEAVDSAHVGEALNVRYCLTGRLRRARNEVTLSVELARTRDRAVVWAERFTAGHDELHRLRQEVLARVVAKLELHIVQQEVASARRLPGPAMDAWSAYHLGLDHMFRFNKADNAQAATYFERALALDPNFSRALSGLSFACFQDSFLQYSGHADEMARRARRLAEQALQCDPLDPFAHLNLGRSLWFERAIPESLDRLATCIELSPNYAQAIYSRAWAEMTLGDVQGSEAHAALALRLSPLDPLRYAMLGVRAISALFDGRYADAADLAEAAARSPGAHKHIAVIAAVAAHADGRASQARHWIARGRQMDAGLSPAAFFRSFPFVRSPGRDLIERSLRDLGLRAPAA